MKHRIFCFYLIFLSFFLLCSLNSCVNSRKLAYFNNIKRDSVSVIQEQAIETKISKNDILQISISVLDPNTSVILNPPNINSVTSSGGEGGYLVDETGVIKLPLLGAITAEGLTKRQLSKLITDDILNKKLAIDPIVVVRILNYKITVLGEVNRPGIIPVPNEKITLPEALGQAGDLTPYGRRNNILLIRDVGNKRIYKRFSLNNDELFDKDIYNLQNQDIIYVEPNNARAASADRTTQLLPIALSVISLLLVIYIQFVKN